jgi:phosphoribosyl-dephospho-CoA transferase
MGYSEDRYMSFTAITLTHDLLRIDPSAFDPLVDEPSWLKSALNETPWVIARRSPGDAGKIAVGARGNKREHRCPGMVPVSAIHERVTPEEIVAKIGSNLSQSHLPAIRCLPLIGQLLSEMEWGPAGSVAFQLVTDFACVSPSSDLDLVIRLSSPISQIEAKAVLESIRKAAPAADALMETPEGGIVLEEYALHNAPWSLRTCYGPRLVSSPWKSVPERGTNQ